MARNKIECERCSEDRYLFKTKRHWLCGNDAATMVDELEARAAEFERANADLVKRLEQVTKALNLYVMLFGNTGYSITRDGAREAYDMAQEALKP